jgi:hypothetical protein
VSACTRLGWQARLGAVSQDGVVCPDVLVNLPSIPTVQFAFELLGSHNTACNSMRILGDAAVKYRLLQVSEIDHERRLTSPVNAELSLRATMLLKLT